jgi:V8-like Glu-specific endopeptidase
VPNTKSAEFSRCNSGPGTGFLVSSDVVLTCQHVVAGSPAAQISLEFDFKVRVPGKPATPGRIYRVKSILETSPATRPRDLPAC